MAQRKNTGKFYIPVAFLEFIASLAKPQPGNRVLDLSWRDDELLSTISRKQPNSLELWGITSRRKASKSKYKIVESELLRESPQLTRESFDILVMNPPWGFRLPSSTLARAETGHTRVDSASLYLEWATWYLRPGATLIASVPSAFLHNYSFKYIRDFLLNRLQLRGVFEFRPATVFGIAISTAVVCFHRPKRESGYKPECFMAEVDSLDNWQPVYELYRLASHSTDSESHFQIGFSRVGKSIAFTSELGDTFSPADTYFARNIFKKLSQFPTIALGDIAEVKTGMMTRSHSSMMIDKGKFSRRFLTAKNLREDGTIAGHSLLKETTTDIKTEKFELHANDILIRTIQPGSKRTGSLSQPDTYTEGVIATIVPPEYVGALYDHSLLRIRLKDKSPAHITPKYIVQLFRNEFVVSGFNHVVLDQIVSASATGTALTRVVPSLLQDIKIPFLPDGVLEPPQVREKGLVPLEQWGQRIIEEITRQGQQISQLVTANGRLTRAQIVELGDKVIGKIHHRLETLQASWENKISQTTPAQRDSLYEERARQIHEFIEREMRERSKVIEEFQDRLATYVFGDYWHSIDSNAHLFLATGEFFYDFSKSMNLTQPDYSGIAVEFCKAVELELWKRLGQHLGAVLIGRGINKYPFWSTVEGKYTCTQAIKRLNSPKATLGNFVGFVWGVIKHLDMTAEKKYRDAGELIYKVIAETSLQLNLLNEDGIPKLLSELTQHRNGSAHKDKLERHKLEELHRIVISFRPNDSIIVQLIQAFPLPNEGRL